MPTPLIPLYERIAAGLVVPAWLWPWFDESDSLLAVVKALFEIVDSLASTLRAGNWSPRQIAELAQMGTTDGLFLSSLIIALQAVLRGCGCAGFLRGRSMWWWTAGHALATIVALPVSEWMTMGSIVNTLWAPLFLSPPLLIAAWVLWYTRRARACTT